MRVLIDVPALTFGDFIDFEDETGESILDAIAAMTKQRATIRQQRALVWIFARRFDRTFSLDDADTLPVQAIEWEIPTRDDDEGGE